jgi:hypothetical protein
MRDAITMQSYQCPTVSTIAPGHKTVKSNLRCIASQLGSTLCGPAAISRKMIVFGAADIVRFGQKLRLCAVPSWPDTDARAVPRQPVSQ